MEIVFGDATIGVKDGRHQYIFSLATGGLESLRKDGIEWLFRAPKPSFWRATTCNDRGCNFPRESAAWMGADLYCHLSDVEAEIDEKKFSSKELSAPDNNTLLKSPWRRAGRVSVTFTYSTCTNPAAQVEVKYTVEDGSLKLDYEYRGVEGLPSLPVVALRLPLPFLLSSYEYEGLSGETYPDRLCGAKEGAFRITDLSLSKYVVPQECGMHMKTKCLVMNHGREQLKVEAVEDDFNFSLLPYTALEIENAFHHEELPPARRTYLLIAAKVRGVGGINSWGAKPEAQYEIPADGTYSFSVILR